LSAALNALAVSARARGLAYLPAGRAVQAPQPAAAQPGHSAQPDGYLRTRWTARSPRSSAAPNSLIRCWPARHWSCATCSRCVMPRMPARGRGRLGRGHTRNRSAACRTGTAVGQVPGRVPAAEPSLATPHRPHQPGNRWVCHRPDPAAARRVRRWPFAPLVYTLSRKRSKLAHRGATFRRQGV